MSFLPVIQMTPTEIQELKSLLDEVAYSSTKNDATASLKRLRFKAAQLPNLSNSYELGKLSEAINYAVEASGRVKNKTHWIEQMESSWYVFEAGVRSLVQKAI